MCVLHVVFERKLVLCNIQDVRSSSGLRRRDTVGFARNSTANRINYTIGRKKTSERSAVCRIYDECSRRTFVTLVLIFFRNSIFP